MTDETDIKLASQTCLSVLKDKTLELDEVERAILRTASILLGECYSFKILCSITP